MEPPSADRLLNVLPKPKQNSSHGSMPESRCRNRKMAELNPSNPIGINVNLESCPEGGCVAGIIRAEGKSTTRTLDELSRPRCHHRNRGRAQLRRRTSRRKGRRRTRGDRRQELGAGINTGYQKRRTPRTAAPSNLATAALTKTARRAPWDPHRVRKMTTHRKGFVQYCKKPRTSQQCQRPACHVHLRGACGRDVGDVEEGIESGRTLSPESEILLPVLVEMPRSRANRIYSSEQDTGIGTVSSALIRDFAIKSAASSAPSVSSRPCSSSSHCPSSAVRSSSASPSTCEFAILARIFVHSNLQVQTERQRRSARDRIHFGTQHGSAVTREGQSRRFQHHVRDRSALAASPARLNYLLQPKSYSYTTLDALGAT